MKKLSIVMLGVMIVITAYFVACSNSKGSSSQLHAMVTVSATMSDTALSGTAEFIEKKGEVTMKLRLSVPLKANQSVAVHIHEKGDCGDKGKMAGGHWNPTNQKHGKWGAGEFHLGDIGNVMLDSKGNGSLQMQTSLWAIGGTGLNNILGKSIIVHSGTDDFTSQPTGNAGSRIGCGIISLTAK